MSESNIIVEKSYKFSVRIVKLYKFLTEKKKNLYYPSRYYDVERQLELISRKQSEPGQKRIL